MDEAEEGKKNSCGQTDAGEDEAATDGFFFSGLGHRKTLVGGSGTIQGGFLFGTFLGELILKFAHQFVFVVDHFSFDCGDGGTAGSFFLLDPFFLF